MSIEEKAGNALDVGVQFGRYIASDEKQDDGLLAFVDALVDAPCETPADALAVMTWSQGLMTEVLKMLVSGDVPAGIIEPAAVAVLLCRKAVSALEAATGLAAEGFGGERRTTN